MRKIVHLFTDLAIVIVLLATDQISKYFVINKLKGQPAIKLIDGVLEVNYLENRGSAFGMLQNQKVFVLSF